jgi:hypothetical protein
MKLPYKLIILIFAGLFMLACVGGAVATVVPTEAPPVATAVPATAEPTAVPTEAPTATEEVPAYVKFESPDGSVVVEVPGDWTKTIDDSTSDVTSYLFTAPDAGGFIQYLVFDDGKTHWSQGNAGKVALAVLNNGYTNGAGDIKISKDEPMPNHSEQLTWSSNKGDYSGITSFKAIGTKLILFTVLYNNSSKDQYFETLNYVLDKLKFVE